MTPSRPPSLIPRYICWLRTAHHAARELTNRLGGWFGMRRWCE